MARSVSIPAQMPIDPEKVSAARAAIGLTQVELAKKAGMSQQAIARIESGLRRDPQLSTAQRLARALGTSIDALIGDERVKKSKRGGSH